MAATDALLRKIYYDARYGFQGLEATYRKARVEDRTITKDQVREFLRRQVLKQDHPAGVRYNSWVPRAPRQEFQIDLIDDGARTRPRYGFVCIDMFTKKVALEPMENKRAEDAKEAFTKVIRQLGLPASIMVDGGSEFQGQFAQYVKTFFEIDIKVSRNSARYVERANFTLRRAIDDRMKALRLPWHRVVKPVVEQYNETPHISSKYSPDFLAKNEQWVGFMKTVNDRYMSKAVLAKPREVLKVGDKVKLRQKPNKFSDYKRDFQHYSREVYEIEGEERVGTQRMYRVKDLRNPVLPSDLVKISGAEEAPEEIVEEQRRLYNPENESAEDPAEDVEEIRAPEGFGDMYEDALRELFLVYCELDGFNEIDDEIEAEGVRRLHEMVVSGQWSAKDLRALGLTPGEEGERFVVNAIRVRSKFRSGIIKRFLRTAREAPKPVRWRGGVLQNPERVIRPTWRSGVLNPVSA